MKWFQRPLEVEVYRLSRSYDIDGPDWLWEAINSRHAWENKRIVDGAVRNDGITLETRGERITVKIGDYLVKDPAGDILAFEPKAFKERYVRKRDDC